MHPGQSYDQEQMGCASVSVFFGLNSTTVGRRAELSSACVPFCLTQLFSSSGPVVYVLDLADRLISKAGPFAAAGIMVGSIYWTAVTYGAVTVMQV